MKSISVLAILVLISGFCHAQLVLKPVADAFVRAGVHQKFNYGKSKELVVKNDKYADQKRVSYLRFDIGSVANSGKALQSAILKLVIKQVIDENVVGDFNLFLKEVEDPNWAEGEGSAESPAENGISYSTKPLAGSNVIAVVKGAKTGTAISFDITDVVAASLKAGKRFVSFEISGSVNLADGTTNGFFSFYSRESARNFPELIMK